MQLPWNCLKKNYYSILILEILHVINDSKYNFASMGKIPALITKTLIA